MFFQGESFQVEVELRTVECAVSFIDDERNSMPLSIKAFSECLSLCSFPFFVGSHRVLRSCGKLDMICKSEHIVNVIDEFRQRR